MDHYDYIFQKLVAAVEDTMKRENFENIEENDTFHHIFDILKDYSGRAAEIESCVFHIVCYYYHFRKNNLVEEMICMYTIE